jgi:succinate dehydrogenase/fumarate reductase flavoprotein subunit
MTAQDSRTRETECDLLVVGSGAGGLSAATTAAWHGLRVVVVEKDGCGPPGTSPRTPCSATPP